MKLAVREEPLLEFAGNARHVEREQQIEKTRANLAGMVADLVRIGAELPSATLAELPEADLPALTEAEVPALSSASG
jgi:hypothetical protein